MEIREYGVGERGARFVAALADLGFERFNLAPTKGPNMSDEAASRRATGKYRPTDDQAADAYEWLADCGMPGIDDMDNEELAYQVNRHYVGGWEAFIADGQ